jgi:hypothetical protein
MSATTHPTSAHLPGTLDRAAQPVPLGRLVRVELRKTVDTRSGTWAIAAIAVVTLVLLTVALVTGAPEDLTFRDLARSTSLTLLLPLLAILVITTEWTQRTALTTFTLEPRRSRVVLAKLAAVTLLGFIALALALAAAALGNVAGTVLADGSGSWAFDASDLRDLALLQLLAMLQAFALGLLIMNTVAAVAVHYIVTPVVSTAFAVTRSLEDVAPWLDLGSASAPLGAGGDVPSDTWGHLAAAASLWIALPMALGLLRLLRREVKAG